MFLNPDLNKNYTDVRFHGVIEKKMDVVQTKRPIKYDRSFCSEEEVSMKKDSTLIPVDERQFKVIVGAAVESGYTVTTTEVFCAPVPVTMKLPAAIEDNAYEPF